MTNTRLRGSTSSIGHKTHKGHLFPGYLCVCVCVWLGQRETERELLLTSTNRKHPVIFV